MSDPVVSLDDFATYLNNPNLNLERALLIIDKAQALCETIVKPLPTGADVVVLDVAERAYAEPMSEGGSQMLYGEGIGPYSSNTPGLTGGGLYLTQENKATLRRLNGKGGAFAIDMLPDQTNVPALPPWDSGTSDAQFLNLP